MYTLLKQGCVLPSVTALQILLNRTRKQNPIKVDGYFGPATRSAVVEFQNMKHLIPDGIVGINTWTGLTKESGLKIVDYVDTTDRQTMLEIVGNIIAAGGNPIAAGGLCGGVNALVSMVLGQVAQSGATVMLRITGHGGPGGQYVTGGRRLWYPDKNGKVLHEGDVVIDHHNNTMKDKAGKIIAVRDSHKDWRDKDGRIVAHDLSLQDEVTIQVMPVGKDLFVVSPHNRMDVYGVEPVLRKLSTIFVKFGSVELHGCSVGAGDMGHRLLRLLAGIWGVPVSAALKFQLSQADFPFRFQGSVATAVPFGGNLKGWSEIVARSS